MQSSPAPHEELRLARTAIEEMRSAQALDAFEEAWKECLRRLERAWNKITAHYERSPKWHSWQGKFSAQRRDDQLLAYLRNARGADEHTVAEIVDRRPSGFGINFRPGFIENFSISVDQGRATVHQSDPNVEVVPLSSRTYLCPVRNRGVDFPIPTRHKGLPVDSGDVVRVAELGLAFYEDVLTQAEKYFVSGEPGV